MRMGWDSGNGMICAIQKLTNLADRRAAGGERMVLVFDGTGGGHDGGGAVTLQGGLRVYWSGIRESADDVIERICSDRGEQVQVVSEDKALLKRVRRPGLKAVSCAKWLGKNKATVSAKREIKSRGASGGKREFGTVDEWLDYFSDDEA